MINLRQARGVGGGGMNYARHRDSEMHYYLVIHALLAFQLMNFSHQKWGN